MHDPQKSHQCDYCDRTFLRAHDKHRHVRSIHMEKKQFVCPTCGAQFARSDALRRHTGRDNTPCYGKVAKGKKGVRLVTIIPEAVLGAEPRPKQPERRAAAPAAPAAPVLPFKLDPPRPGKRRRRAWDDEDSDGSEGGSEAASPAVRGSDRDGVYD
ncbi:hypothetical protein DFJ74DRAFT_672429 [Hyaloraphidium curvatum]|nr:hypothetical protein DFJ74DRAFT_672429 [Hyaloraphidium curvatum]